MDNCTPAEVASHLPEHDVKTAWQMGWAELENGELIAAATKSGFDVMITTDKKIRSQKKGVLNIGIVQLTQPEGAGLPENRGVIRYHVEKTPKGEFSTAIIVSPPPPSQNLPKKGFRL